MFNTCMRVPGKKRPRSIEAIIEFDYLGHTIRMSNAMGFPEITIDNTGFVYNLYPEVDNDTAVGLMDALAFIRGKSKHHTQSSVSIEDILEGHDVQHFEDTFDNILDTEDGEH